MRNIFAVSIPKCHALSNGALRFPVCLILFAGKWRKLFTETVLAFNLHFQQLGLGLKLQESAVQNSKERKILV
jgi:hypothetical protein